MELNDESLAFLAKLVVCGKVRDAKNFDLGDCKRFWHSAQAVNWFEEKGYTVYKESHKGVWWDEPNLPFDDYCKSNYPFSYHQAVDGLAVLDMTGKIIFAQDHQQRHVVIKLTRIGSDEYRILRFLHEQGLEVMEHHCILPILELLHCGDACFAVMPRWGSAIYLPHSNTLGGFLLIMQSMLKALTFLHNNNIIHRDLNMDNMVVNFFGNDLTMAEGGYYPLRSYHLAGGLLSYALIDFDLSIMLLPDVQKEGFRLPRQQSWVGTFYPSDTLQGEIDYNPFAFDVGTLGVVFCNSYQKYTTEIPMLAPFFDRMITRDVRNRFTAAQALEFLNDIIKKATVAQLSIPEISDPTSRHTGDYEAYDRWKGLPADFQEKWAAYREPIGIPLSWKLLRTIRGSRWLPESLIPNLRRLKLKIRSYSKRI